MSTPKHSRRRLGRLGRIKRYILKHRKLSIIIGTFVLILIAAGVTLAIILTRDKPEPPQPSPAPTVKEEPKIEPKYYSPLTGELVKSEKDTTKPVSAIMIENSPEARPQSGLGSAEVVYEAIAEGGVTRFLAMYQQNQPELVGPVRSLRMYYVDWLAPYNAGVFHVGGSKQALDEIRNGSYRDLDQFFNAGSYWRSSDRYAPHNVYTNFKRISALNKAKGFKTSNPTAFDRKDTEPSESPSAKSVSVNISAPTYNSKYTYDKKTNMYLRSQAGQPHKDTESGRIKARVVVVMKTDMREVMQDGIREDYRTTGTGDAWIFQDGDVHQVKWHKKNRKDQLNFTSKDSGEKFELARGTTWITALPADRTVTWQ